MVFSKKLRLVVDASRGLNPYLMDRKVKLETLDRAEQVVKEEDWQTKQDLDSGYWHLALAKDHQKYVGVHLIQDDGSITYWVWKVLFLGGIVVLVA